MPTRPQVKTAPPPLRDRMVKKVVGVGLYALCLLVALTHAVALSTLHPDGSASSKSIDWLLLLVPALLTAVLLPSSVRHWRRWLAFAAIAFIADPTWTLYAIVVTESWVLHREWVVDRVPGELARLVPDRLRRIPLRGNRQPREKSKRRPVTPKSPKTVSRAS
jgi:hypothetical protein